MSFGITASVFGAGEPIENEVEWIEEIEVKAKRVALDNPAGTYAATVTALRFDPSVELQIEVYRKDKPTLQLEVVCLKILVSK